MKSFSLDYLFNRVYDVLLWFKYVFLFVILREDKTQYLTDHKDSTWDGLRDRGWLTTDDTVAVNNSGVPTTETETTWERLMDRFGLSTKDSDGDGIPNYKDSHPYDPDNLTQAQIKERFQEDYSFWDNVRDFFGRGPKDSDGDGVPDSYELKHNLDPHNPDTDYDGLSDGKELLVGTNPTNPDTDGDQVMDSRDEGPLDPTVTSRGLDTDGDGVSDEIEKLLGTDINKKDSDGDGVSDGMDTYPLDSTNVGTHTTVPDITQVTGGLHLAIQNPVLAFFSNVYSVLAVFVLIFLAYVLLRYLYVYLESFRIFDKHFVPPSATRNVKDDTEVYNVNPAGIPGLPIKEDFAPDQIVVRGHEVSPPKPSEFIVHPRWAIIEGYLASKEEALWRIGILEADNMLADALREKGYIGEDVGEMLLSANFRSVQLAWDAHKVRNRIAHEGSKFTLTEREARRTFALYEAVFREFKII